MIFIETFFYTIAKVIQFLLKLLLILAQNKNPILILKIIPFSYKQINMSWFMKYLGEDKQGHSKYFKESS